MRKFISILLVFIVTKSLGQDTLREVNTFMYTIEYILYPDNSFKSEFHHCTGVTYGHGTYDQRRRKMIFEFDSVPPQKLSVNCINNLPSDSVHIIALNSFDSSACQTCYYISEDKLIITDTNQFSVLLPNDTLIVKCAGQYKQTIFLDSQGCSVYELYLPYAGVSYSGSYKLILQRESKYLYSRTYINWDENTEKPWRKGKKRKGKNYYVLIKK